MATMHCSKWFLLLSFLTINLPSPNSAQIAFTYICSDTAGNYTNNSTYQKKLKTLFNSMVSNTEVDYGFYNTSVGQGTNRVEAIALCRSDVDPSSCCGFINQSANDILAGCPNNKVGIGWLDEIMLRYSNSSIFNVLEKENYLNLISPYNVSEGTWDSFSKTLQVLLSDLQSKAAAGDSMRKSAAGNASLDSHTIFSLVQCTPDLLEKECSDCLVEAAATIEDCCAESDGARILKGRCSLQYEMDRVFFQFSTYNTPSPQLHCHRKYQDQKTKISVIIIIVVVSIVAALLLIISICIFLRRRGGRKATTKKGIENGIDDFSKISSDESLHFDFNTIKSATQSFSTANKLGQGGFRAVYKDRIANGQEIAVKRQSKNSAQGDQEFTNEILLVAKLQHRNLVRLLGFSLAGNERLLIYEFLPNTSLDHFIFNPVKRLFLDWEKRYKIIGGIARGLLYLHEDSRLRIIHRNLKASNSFGVLVLEILTDQKNSCFRNTE